MAGTLFRSTSFTLRHLVENVDRGDVALPELQRPFVWSNSKARELFDSMFKGFPVGFLLFWETGAGVGARQIGTDDKDAKVARWLIVDGQQRLTSLYSVLTGHPVIREDYSESRVKLAFRPRDAQFAVTDAAIEKDPEYLPDITELWRDYRSTVTGYFDRLEGARGSLENADRNRLDDTLDRVRDLQNYPFNVIELDSAVNEEQVGDVFVRINSAGVLLSQADFILTLMSVFWDKGRKEMEDFARSCKMPSAGKASPFNWYIAPQPDQLLRVTVAVAFRRAVLRIAYSVLRGKDLDTGEVNEDRREEQFTRLAAAQAKVLDLTNWHEFLLCLERAGYRSSKMISSDNAILYTYAMWLIGRIDYGVSVAKLREVIARWFFMAHTTARYSGSFESRVESDIALLADLTDGDAAGFVATLDRVIDDTLTTDFWNITLPNELSTSAARSPALFAYFAALNVLDAEALLSTGRVRARLDPAVIAKKGIERHHLFPRAYLRDSLAVKDTKQINQIANMALVEWNDNIAISDKAPAIYWDEQVASKALDPDRLALQLKLHALPDGWVDMSYQEFLAARRRLMASVARDAFKSLRDSGYVATYPEVAVPVDDSFSTRGGEVAESGSRVTVAQLMEAGPLPAGTILTSSVPRSDAIAEIDERGRIVFEDELYDTPSGAASAAGERVNGWYFWNAELDGGTVSLESIRRRYLQ